MDLPNKKALVVSAKVNAMYAIFFFMVDLLIFGHKNSTLAELLGAGVLFSFV
jgi:hypothetical protein